jgi:hypothetical protein
MSAPGSEPVILTNTCLEHLGLVAGFVLGAIISERAVADVPVRKGVG